MSGAPTASAAGTLNRDPAAPAYQFFAVRFAASC